MTIEHTMLGDFSHQADAYQRSRPDYPPAIVDQLVADARVEFGDPVADIGAGTGIFTKLLAERGLRVTAVEPNDDMRVKAEQLAGVSWMKGTLEDTTLADASQRWVVAAQAFHWADAKRSLPEMRRILEPDGAFTVLWNNRANEESGLLRWTQEAISRHVPEFDHDYRQQDWAATLTSTGDFTSVLHRTMRHVVPMTKERFVDLWRSHNRLNTLAGTQRMNWLLSELADYVKRLDVEKLLVPYVCEGWTAR